MAIQERLHVLIIGAGTTGLLIGQGLKKAGILHSIFEREDENTYRHRPREWTMALHWGSDYINKCLPEDLVARLPEAMTNATIEVTPEQEETLEFLNGKTGEVAAVIKGGSTKRAVRRKLRELFATGLGVQYGKRFVKLKEERETVTAYFEDGSSATGNVLVGCDGTHGIVREVILPPGKAELELCNHTAVNITNTFTAEQTKFIRSLHHPYLKIGIHPSNGACACLMAADTTATEIGTWQLILTQWGSTLQPESNEERMKRMKQLSAEFCEPFRSAFSWVKDDTYIFPDRFASWNSSALWDNHSGRITLAGDAAHPMTPFRGQGLNNALQDSASFCEALQSIPEDKSLKEAIDVYDKEVYQRGVREIQISLKVGYATHHLDDFVKSTLATSGMKKVPTEEGKDQ